jgi:hypothetical protein
MMEVLRRKMKKAKRKASKDKSQKGRVRKERHVGARVLERRKNGGHPNGIKRERVASVVNVQYVYFIDSQRITSDSSNFYGT